MSLIFKYILETIVIETGDINDKYKSLTSK